MGGGYIAKAKPLCHSEERSDEESQAMREYYIYIPDKRVSQAAHGIRESWVDRPER